MRKTLLGLAAVLATATPAIGAAEAATATPCTGPLSSTTVGRLQVPSGAACILTDVVVNGNIRVRTDATLLSTDSTINGSLLGRGARTVELIDTDVVGTGTAGNINLTDTSRRIVIGSEGCAVDPGTGNNIILVGNHGTIAICYMTVGETIMLRDNHKTIGAFHNTIGNPFLIQHNRAAFIRLRDNEVGVSGGGSMLVQNNTTTGNAAKPDGLRLMRNYSHNRLNCTGNDDAPVGMGNAADNGMLGQCAGLS